VPRQSGYRTIVADPPWDVKAGPRSLHDPGERTRALTYPTMSVAEIAALPVDALGLGQGT
jgi:N6-adenosine-specific RNA methylase IME4